VTGAHSNCCTKHFDLLFLHVKTFFEIKSNIRLPSKPNLAKCDYTYTGNTLHIYIDDRFNEYSLVFFHVRCCWNNVNVVVELDDNL